MSILSVENPTILSNSALSPAGAETSPSDTIVVVLKFVTNLGTLVSSIEVRASSVYILLFVVLVFLSAGDVP